MRSALAPLLCAACSGTPAATFDAPPAPTYDAPPAAGADAPATVRPDGPTAAPDAPPLTLTKVRTEYVGKLFGTERTPLAPIGLIGTDLGVSYVQSGTLYFLFGDSWTIPADVAFWNDDSIAETSPAWPADDEVPPIFWHLDPSGRFRSLRIPGVDLGGMNVPVEGVPAGDRTYLFASSGFDAKTGIHSASALGHFAGGDDSAIVLDHAVASAKFINVSVVPDADALWIFGSGPYRRSPVYLAHVALADLPDRSAWRYWNGHDLVAGESAAQPVVDVSCVGELSVRRHPTLPLYIMAYNCDTPRGIVFRTASAPTGPWSDGQVIFDPGPDADHGYGFFMHARPSVVGYDDGLAEPGRDEEWGGEYGPYFVPTWFADGPPGVHTITYTLSSWNPYAVHVVRTVFTEPGAIAGPASNRGAGLPATKLRNGDFTAGLSGWQTSGDPFRVFTGADGKPRVTTYGDAGDATMGKMWQSFTVDGIVSEIDFAVHGGHAAVQLWHGADLVRSTHGRDTNDVELPVRWRLDMYRGETLRLVIDDELNEPWGFVGTTGFSFR
jgi:hypothetical protein